MLNLASVVQDQKMENQKLGPLSFSNYFVLNSLRMNMNRVLASRIMEAPKACSDFH